MPETPDVREQLAAYLAGELDAADSAAIEARMASEPWVAEAADDMADMLARIGRVDDVEPPVGFSARLRESLANEIGHEIPRVASVDPALVRTSGAAAADGWSSRPPGRADARRPGPRKAGRTRLNRAVLGVAAAVAVLFVGSTAVFLGGGLMSGSDTADSVADTGSTTREFAGTTEDSAEEEGRTGDVAADEGAPAAADLAAEMAQPEAAADEPATNADALADSTAMQGDAASDDSADASTEASAADGATLAAPAAGSAEGAGPEVLVLDEVADDDAIRSGLGQRPAVDGLLGRPASDGAALADPYRDEILRADSFPDGTPPGVCLQEVLGDAEGVVVPAVAGQFTQDGQARIGYALVRSSDGETLDQVDIWIVTAEDCAVVAVLS